jgi:hypothetical protein
MRSKLLAALLYFGFFAFYVWLISLAANAQCGVSGFWDGMKMWFHFPC